MSLLVLAYPQLSMKDFNFIQDYRKKNDSRYFSIVNPHFTIVFQNKILDETTFISEVEKKIRGFRQFFFVIRCASINQNDDGTYYNEFFVPDEGYSNFVKLHDRLYSGIFYEFLRFDIDYIPHIGIGNSNEVHVSKKRIDSLNEMNFEIKGTIREIDIVRYEDNTVTTIKKLNL